MLSLLKKTLWLQMGAAIDMLSNAIKTCPEKLWDTQEVFWYKVYHTLFFADYYLSENPDDFRPPTPFSLSEMDPLGKMPERTYTSQELLVYTAFCKEKCKALIDTLTDDSIHYRFINTYRNYSRLEIILYNIRHIQHHTGQLNILIRQHGFDAPHWVSQVIPSV